MDIKIEVKQIKLEDDYVKTETKDWFSKVVCKTEDVKVANLDIIDLSMDD
jgi:Ran GTPase-activating protein (RanGAP) involved in mRNA processing and transport